MSAVTAEGPPATQRGPNALVARGVRRAFGDHVVLDGLDLTIRHGEVVALLGRSGSGKSTLLRIAADLDHGAEGEVHVPERRAVVFQDPRLVPWKRVIHNVMLGVEGGDVRRRAVDLLDELGLGRHRRAWPATLSGGEAQRVALARALIRNPELLLLDEPFGALDALTRLRMHDLLREMLIRYRPAVLFVTHDVEEALLLADRVVVLDEGRLVVDEQVDLPPPRHVTSEPFQRVRARLLRALGVDLDAT